MACVPATPEPAICEPISRSTAPGPSTCPQVLQQNLHAQADQHEAAHEIEARSDPADVTIDSLQWCSPSLLGN